MASNDTQQANKAVSKEVMEQAVGGKNYDVLQRTLAANFVSHGGPGAPEGYTGREAAEQRLRGLHSAFPDLQVTVEAMVAEDDVVAVRARYTGTHEGEFMGIPGTGKQITMQVMGFHRFEDGKIVEAWAQTDTGLALKELGAVQAPPGA